jgi:hypothetical protein
MLPTAIPKSSRAASMNPMSLYLRRILKPKQMDFE